MHVTQYLKDHVPPIPRKPKKDSKGLTKAELQRRYRANVQRRLQTLREIEALIAALKEAEE